MSRRNGSRYRILALDVDGTLLDRDGTLRPSTAEAVARAARAGIRPVLCTGRRYRRAPADRRAARARRPARLQLGDAGQGPGGHRTLWRADLDADSLAKVLALFRDRDEPAVSFRDDPPDAPDFVVGARPDWAAPCSTTIWA